MELPLHIAGGSDITDMASMEPMKTTVTTYMSQFKKTKEAV